MLISLKELKGYKIRAIDGDIGSIHDFYFDDLSWRMRFFVVETGGWLLGRKVLIAPGALENPDGTDKVIPTRLTMEQVKNAPDVSTEQPVSRQSVAGVFQYYGWPLYFEAPGSMSAAAVPMTGVEPPAEEDVDQHLQSARSVMGYDIAATDGDIRHVEDFVYDHDDYVIRYLVADTKDWLPGRHVILTTDSVKSISWTERKVSVDQTRAEVESSPEYDPLKPLEREQETNIFTHFRRRPYWII